MHQVRAAPEPYLTMHPTTADPSTGDLCMQTQRAEEGAAPAGRAMSRRWRCCW